MLDFNPKFPFNRKACAALFREPTTLTAPIMTMLLAAYGADVFEADPIELYLAVEEDFHAKVPEETENRIQAALTAMTTDLFFTDGLACRSISLAFFEGDLGDIVNGVLEPVEFAEVLWATYEVGLLRDDKMDFSPQVKAWLDSLMRQDAEDPEEMAPETLGLPFYVRSLQDQKLELERQLESIGVSLEGLPKPLEN